MSLKKGMSFVGESIDFFKKSYGEIPKVTWPTRKDVVITSIIVFILAAICSVFLFFVDQIIIMGLKAIFGVGNG